MEKIFLYCILVFSFIQTLLIIILLVKKNPNNNENLSIIFGNYEKRLDKNELTVKDEINRVRMEISSSSKNSREELNQIFTNFTTILAQKQDNLTRETRETLEKVRESVEKRLYSIQVDNNAKLEQMRETVDEKLHKTLETRLGESFKLVSDRLELVQKGLGEMQNLANDVGGLKKVLSNVKTKGVLGEYQLDSILDQIMSPTQYKKNVKPIPTSNSIVEFAVCIPSKESEGKTVYLPIDAKFPTEDYSRLQEAYENGNQESIEQNQKALQDKIKKFANDIKTKYIEPPYTTDFAIMFLPFEGLYAEVLRIPGLFEYIQREYKVTISGPTTISAFLNSLQMGFRTLAVEKRTSEIWDLLGAVRTEFGKFGDVLQKTKDRLEAASKEIDTAETRSRAIERKLKNVQSLPQTQTDKLLNDE